MQQNNYNQNRYQNRGVGGFTHPMQVSGPNQFGQQRNNQRRIEKKKNPFGDTSLKTIDYLDGKSLLKFTNSRGKILPKRITGASAYQQRQIAKAIKYARHLALIPFVGQDLS